MKQSRRVTFLPLAVALWSLSAAPHVSSFAVLHQRQQLRHAAATTRRTSDSPTLEYLQPLHLVSPQQAQHFERNRSRRYTSLTQRFISPQNSQPDAASSPSSNQHNSHRRRRRRSTTSVLHAANKATLEKPTVVLKKSKRILERSKQLTGSSSAEGETRSPKKDSANALRLTMMTHELLTREQEYELGKRIKLAQKYQDKLTELARVSLNAQDEASSTSFGTTEQQSPRKRGRQSEQQSPRKRGRQRVDPILPPPQSYFRGASMFEDDEEDTWIGGSNFHSIMTPNGKNNRINSGRPHRMHAEENEDDDEMQNLSVYDVEQLEAEPRPNWSDHESSEEADGSFIPTIGDTRTSDRSRSKSQSIERPREERRLVTEMLETLSDSKIRHLFGLQGGRIELQRILLDGAMARDTLIKHNIRLVVSIAKKWCCQQARGSDFGNKKSGSIYRGSWDRPSLDEVIQEGIMGLASAADRFQPSRNLRFSTYATFWVTNMVRKCFQSYSNGLRVPVGYYETRARFRALIKACHEQGEPVPPMEELAKKMGLPVSRLKLILQVTKSVDSIDAPFFQGTFVSAGKAGGIDQPFGSLADMLVDQEPSPQEQVELSFLRQSLENAMASELVPYERDIVRLRLGLDDGVSRTVRQISDEYGGALSVFEVKSAEQRAYRKLRSPYTLSTYKLLAYLDFAGIDRDDAFDGV